jgi:hypothetical protein
MLREATLKDVKPLLGFLKPFHEEGGYKDIAPQTKLAHTNLQVMLSSPMHKIWVVERDGRICSALGVVSQELWFTKRHYATNLFLCANGEGRGTAGFLLRCFKKWLDSRPIIKDVTFAITSELGDVDRVEKLYQAVGFKKLGGLFRLEI